MAPLLGCRVTETANSSVMQMLSTQAHLQIHLYQPQLLRQLQQACTSCHQPQQWSLMQPWGPLQCPRMVCIPIVAMDWIKPQQQVVETLRALPYRSCNNWSTVESCHLAGLRRIVTSSVAWYRVCSPLPA